MPSSPPPIPPSALLAAAVVAMAIAAAFGVARGQWRRVRREARVTVEALVGQIGAFHAGALRPSELRRAVRASSSDAFWAALETVPLAAHRPRRQALSRALAGIPHTRRERRALRDDSPWRRELAARRLALVEEPASRRALRAALARGPELVTLAAATALGRYRDARGLRWLIAHPESLAGRTPRALVAMLRAYGRGALALLADALERGGIDGGTPGAARLERALIETLGLGGHTLAAPAIARRLAREEVEVRVAAARALGRLRAQAGVGDLVAALADEAWPVRAVTAWALGQIGVPAAVEPLATRLTDRAWWVRRHAAYALSEIGEAGRAALRQIAATSPDPYARDMAREALGDGSDLGAA